MKTKKVDRKAEGGRRKAEASEGRNGESLPERILQGNAAAIARGITLAAAGGTRGEKLIEALSAAPKKAHRIGITGPLGAGKSTLIGALASLLRARGERVGVIACDPASQETGGA